MNILLYLSPICPYSHSVKTFLTEKGVPFHPIDVSTDDRQLKRMIQISNQIGVPVTSINNRVVVGMNQSELERIIGEEQAKEST